MLPSAGPGSENAAAKINIIYLSNAAVVVIALETEADRSVCDVEGV